MQLTFEPTDFLRRLCSLIPPPRQNLTRYHGVFASQSAWKKMIAPKVEKHAEDCGHSNSKENGTKHTYRLN